MRAHQLNTSDSLSSLNPNSGTTLATEPKKRGRTWVAACGWMAMAAWSAVTGTGCMVNLDVVGDSGMTVTEDRYLGSFSRISLSGNVHVTVVEGHSYSAQVTGDGDVTPYCRTDIRNGTLEVDVDDFYADGSPVEVVISTPSSQF